MTDRYNHTVETRVAVLETNHNTMDKNISNMADDIKHILAIINSGKGSLATAIIIANIFSTVIIEGLNIFFHHM